MCASVIRMTRSQAQPRDQVVPVRFTETGVATIDTNRKHLDRSEYLRQALAFAINHGFKVADKPKGTF